MEAGCEERVPHTGDTEAVVPVEGTDQPEKRDLTDTGVVGEAGDGAFDVIGADVLRSQPDRVRSGDLAGGVHVLQVDGDASEGAFPIVVGLGVPATGRTVDQEEILHAGTERVPHRTTTPYIEQ